MDKFWEEIADVNMMLHTTYNTLYDFNQIPCFEDCFRDVKY